MVFQNPYQFSGTIMAKIAVNLATIFWSAIVLYKDGALSPFVGYSRILSIANENTVAALLIIVSIIQMIRIVRCSKPLLLGISGYALLTLFWMNVWWNIVINPGPIWPASFSSVSVIVLLSLYAFIANPKKI